MRPHLWLLAGALCLGASACRDPQPAAPVDPDPQGAAPPADGLSAAPTDRTDPGPQLERPVGEKPAVTRPGVALEVDAIEIVDGAVYLRALVPPDPTQVVVGPYDQASAEVLGDRYGVAVPAAQGRLPDRPWLYVRLAGDAPPPDPLVVRWRQAALLDGEPGQIQDLTLIGASKARPFPRLAPRVREAMGQWFANRRMVRPTAFDAFASGRLRAWRSTDPIRRTRSAEPVEMQALDTAPLTPSLMRDRGLRLPLVGGGAVPLSAIEPPPVVGSPWRAIIDALPARPAADPLAAWAPAEWIYLRLAGIEAGLALLDEAGALFGPVVAALQATPGDARRFDRLLATLDLDRAGLDALAPATGRAAVLSTDPMLSDGPGLAAVIEVTDAALVEAFFAKWDAAAGQRGVRIDRITVADRPVQRMRGRGLEAYRALADDMLVVSNSGAVLERVFAARAGDRSLGGTEGFVALRGRVPPSEDEVAFAMVGEGQLAHLASPGLRLLAARRAQALVDLRAVGFAGLLYGWLEGRRLDLSRPADRAALMASGLLTEADLRHDDGGAITLDGGVACSKIWGCAGAARPLIGRTPIAITDAEAGAYRRLRAEWLDRWRERVAPMAVSVRRRPKGYAVSGQMLPLTKVHDWIDVARHFGDVRVASVTGPGLEVRMALAPEAPLRAEWDAQLRALTEQRDLGLSWLGDHVVAGIVDRSGIWDGVLNTFELPNTVGRRLWRGTAQRKQVLDRLPVYLRAPVADRAALDRALTGLRAFAGSPTSPIALGDAPAYRGVSVIELRELLSEADNRVGLYLGVAGETLVMGVERATFEMAVDATLDGEEAAAAVGPAQARLRLTLAPDGWLQRAALGAFERLAINRLAPTRRSFAAVADGATLPPAGAALDALLIRSLGYIPTGPHGDRPRLTSEGDVTLPRYGTAFAPSWPAIPLAGDPLATLATLDASLGFDGPPGRTAVVVELSWTRR